jgi:hypothetical protein
MAALSSPIQNLSNKISVYDAPHSGRVVLTLGDFLCILIHPLHPHNISQVAEL